MAVIKLIGLILIIIFILDEGCHAFDVEGFRSGMSSKVALQIARQHDSTAKLSSRIGPQAFGMDFDSYMNNNDTSVSWQLFFCEDRLVELRRFSTLHWPFMTQIVLKLNDFYGYGNVRTSTEDFGLSKHYNIELHWHNDTDTVLIALTETRYEQEHLRDKKSMSEYYRVKDGIKTCRSHTQR